MAGEHIPRGTPTCECGVLALDHRPGHLPRHWPICDCGALAKNHRVKHPYKGDGQNCSHCYLERRNHISQGPSHASSYRIDYVGIDGEGIGRRPHKYVLLCAAAADGRRWMLEDVQGLSSLRMLHWIVSTLDNCRVFSYGFGYDITHLVRDLPDESIYRLLRPHLRYEDGKLRPIRWHGFQLDWLQGRLTIEHKRRRVVIWDILKFFQQSFVASLKDWGIDVRHIEVMKAKRASFTAKDMPELRQYCPTECGQLAELARKLLTAHKNAGLVLKSYYGPGSTASVALGQMKVKEFQSDPPEDMLDPIARAFFGGRFEHSHMGIVKPVYAYDISSAYPYHAYQLPCLAHGKWRWVTRNVEKHLRSCTAALVRYQYRGKTSDVWAPFPHRDLKGNTCYPYANQGWAWLSEYQAAKPFGRVLTDGAWVYNSGCDCRPFAKLAEYYRARVALGKDAQGRVLKLAINSVYGKLAQSRGHNPPYQNWIWAGMITAGTRAQVLHAIPNTFRRGDIVGIATDGLFSASKLNLARPGDTGTSDLAKPLGGWEEKVYPEGVLFLKPGIYLPLKGPAHMFEGNDAEPCEKCGLDKDDHPAVKARGVGRKKLTEQRDLIVKAWGKGAKGWTVEVERFFGAKSSINPRRRLPRFGQWDTMPINVAFECPNRTDTMGLLKRVGMSHPYDPARVTIDDVVAQMHEDISYEQP